MSNFNKNINKYKKYAFRKIGKYFGPCVIGTMISLGVAVTLPSNNAHASTNDSGKKPVPITDISSSVDGYEVRIPKGKKYVRNDEVDNHTPRLIHEGKDGRSFIQKADASENLSEEKINEHFEDNHMESLFEKLYDEDGDDEIDPEYKRADADTINEHAGNKIAGTDFVEPKVSEVDPKYPHRVDAGVTNITEIYDSNNDGKPDRADGQIDDNDTIVEANKPIEVDPEAENNVVKEDGTVVLSKYYRIHVNEGDTADKDDDIYEVGTKPKVEETPIDFTTRYVEDKTKDKDYRETTQAGVKGKETKTTTYTLDTNNGTVTENTPTVVREEPKEEIITVGTKPKVEETPIDFTTRYVEDKTKDKDYRETTQAGVKGKETTTTTYTMDPNNGTVTENTPTVVREEPKEEIITVGTKPKVVEKELPFTTRYVEDNTKDKDYRETTQVGVKGKETTTTTYT
ncbi:G5 domain-containing protein, partial [Gemella sp.]